MALFVRKKILVFAALIVLNLSWMYGQLNYSQGEFVDEKAQKILAKTVALITESQNIRLTLKLSSQDEGRVAGEDLDATIIFNNEKYVAEVHGQKIFCDGKSVWVLQTEINEVQIYPYDSSEDNIFNFGSLIANASKNFRPKLIEEKNEGGARFSIVDLVPRKEHEFYKIRLKINNQTSRFDLIEIYYRNGSKLFAEVKEWKRNLQLSPSAFTFDQKQYPNVEVIDMR